MNAMQIIGHVHAAGGQLSILHGKLRGRHLAPETRELVRKHRVDIIRLMEQKQPTRTRSRRVAPGRITGLPCGRCHGTTYRLAKDSFELPDGEAVDGWECIGCGSVFLLSGNRNVEPEHKKRLLHPEAKRPTRDIEKPSLVALSWLHSHRQELRAAGWSSASLWRRNKARGIAWLMIWDRPGLSVILVHDGAIVFSYTNETGRSITQTAWPREGER